MNKDAYYYPHFSNARTDRKLQRVRKELGIEGYAIYFMLLEVLRDTDGFKYPTEDIDLLAIDFGTSEQKVRTVICNYNLFQIDENQCFYSEKLIEYLGPYLRMKEQRKIAGAASAAKRKFNENSTTVEHPLNDRSTTVQQSKVKKSKVKESKEGREFTPPTIDEVYEEMAMRIDLTTAKIESSKFFNYYESNGWKVGENKMKNWRAAAAGWICRMPNYQSKINGNGTHRNGVNGKLSDTAKPGAILSDI